MKVQNAAGDGEIANNRRTRNCIQLISADTSPHSHGYSLDLSAHSTAYPLQNAANSPLLRHHRADTPFSTIAIRNPIRSVLRNCLLFFLIT